MARTSLAERMSRLEQQRAKLAEQEAKLRSDERKQRTRRLVDVGTFVERAGLIDLEDAALYGALLSLASTANDKSRIAEWAKAGKAALDRSAANDSATREALLVTFPASLPTAFSTRLRAAGLRWNKLLQHWEGLADHDTVAALAGEQNGNVRRVRTAAELDRPQGRGSKSEQS